MRKVRKAWNGGSKDAAMAEAKARDDAVISAKQKFKAHKVMTPEEYAAMPIVGWHEVCRDYDGFGGVGIRFLSERQTHASQDEVKSLREALTIAEDVLSRAPFSTEIWPNGMHPQRGINKIRKALGANQQIGMKP